MADDNPQPSFKSGDRVQVADDWFHAPLRGAIGTIIDTPQGVKDLRSSGVYWVEFDELQDGNTDSAEIKAESLRLTRLPG